MHVRNLFGTLESLHNFFGASHKRNAYIENAQKAHNVKNKRSLKQLSDTRWASRASAIDNVVEIFDALVDALNDVIKKGDNKSIVEARGLLKSISSYEFILTMHIFMGIFSITSPLSKYLQQKGLDIITTFTMIDNAYISLENMRTSYSEIEKKAQLFAIEHGLTADFERKRSRRSKRHEGDYGSDDPDIELTPSESYRINHYLEIINQCTTSLHNRFLRNRQVLQEFALLDPCKFSKISESDINDKSAFKNIISLYPMLNVKDLKRELCSFRSLYPSILSKSKKVRENDGSTELTEDQQPSDIVQKNETQSAVLKCYSTIVHCNLQIAYPNLFTMYQILLTLPVSSAEAERSFSKLGLVKSKLRSTMTDERLSNLIILGVEKDLLMRLKTDDIIDRFADTAELRENLVY